MHTACLPAIHHLATRCQYLGKSSSKQAWTGLQWWPPDVTSRGARDRGFYVWCLMEGACTVRSNASWVMVTWGVPVDRETDRHTPVKHYLPTTSLAEGNKSCSSTQTGNELFNWQSIISTADCTEQPCYMYCVTRFWEILCHFSQVSLNLVEVSWLIHYIRNEVVAR